MNEFDWSCVSLGCICMFDMTLWTLKVNFIQVYYTYIFSGFCLKVPLQWSDSEMVRLSSCGILQVGWENGTRIRGDILV